MTEDQKKPDKGLISNLKEKFDDKEEQLNILATFVRLGVLVWSGGILTLTYVAIPGIPQQKIDPTFIASVFTGTLATFGVQAAKEKDGKNGNGHSVSREEMMLMIQNSQRAKDEKSN